MAFFATSLITLMSSTNLLFGHSSVICLMVWLSFPQSKFGLSFNLQLHLYITYLHLSCMVLIRFRIVHSWHGITNISRHFLCGILYQFPIFTVVLSHSPIIFLQYRITTELVLHVWYMVVFLSLQLANWISKLFVENWDLLSNKF